MIILVPSSYEGKLLALKLLTHTIQDTQHNKIQLSKYNTLLLFAYHYVARVQYNIIILNSEYECFLQRMISVTNYFTLVHE